MKKLLLLTTIAMLLLSCCSTSEEDKLKQRQAVHFLDEDFILIDAKEDIAGGDNGYAYKVRTWVITRVLRDHPDSIQQAEIISSLYPNHSTRDFQITNELWYGKPIGSTLHFDYIRKDRFFKIPATKVQTIQQKPTLTTEPTVSTTGNKMQIELDILKLEREMIMLKEELKKHN